LLPYGFSNERSSSDSRKMNQPVPKWPTTIGNFKEKKRRADPDVVSQQIGGTG
jgi:hypothetical protein